MTDGADDPSPLMSRGLVDPRNWRRRWDAGELIHENDGIVMITGDNERAGVISWATHQWFGDHCWSLGIQVVPAMRGQGIGTRAHELMVSYLFDRTVRNRIEAHTEVDNIAERRALEKAGFTLEGILHGACFRGGKWRDGALYSIVRP